MNNSLRKLQIEQLDGKLKEMKSCFNVRLPSNGWLFTIRRTLNVSLKQVGNKLGISSQSVREMEERERSKNITLKSLSQAADAIDMQLVYAIVPKDDSLEKLIDRKAKQLAYQIVMRTSHSMSLEDQENMPDRIKKAIDEKAEKLKNELPRYLWD